MPKHGFPAGTNVNVFFEGAPAIIWARVDNKIETFTRLGTGTNLHTTRCRDLRSRHRAQILAGTINRVYTRRASVPGHQICAGNR